MNVKDVISYLLIMAMFLFCFITCSLAITKYVDNGGYAGKIIVGQAHDK